MNIEIPKNIHYCWFGRNPLPESAQKCIASWRKYLPDYKIIEWNEDNFDVNIIPYTQQAYEAKKYAFVSDYARFKILYNQGGLYFDTDVEVIRAMDDIIAKGPFMGFEIDPKKSDYGAVAPGLGLGVTPGLGLYKRILDYYSQLQFYTSENSLDTTTVVIHTTNLLIERGLKPISGIQEVDGIYIYPKEYFNPLNDNTGELKITENTRSIHWYTKSWLKPRNKIVKKAIRLFHKYLGDNSLSWIKRLISYHN